MQDRSVADPMAFQLAINYRSHGGIVNCAHTVIECITKFWPDAIDDLQPEHGVVDGLKPVFFHGWDQDTVRYEQFLFGASYVDIILFLVPSDACLTSGSRIEFGAQQCLCNIPAVNHCAYTITPKASLYEMMKRSKNCARKSGRSV